MREKRQNNRYGGRDWNPAPLAYEFQTKSSLSHYKGDPQVLGRVVTESAALDVFRTVTTTKEHYQVEDKEAVREIDR